MDEGACIIIEDSDEEEVECVELNEKAEQRLQSGTEYSSDPNIVENPMYCDEDLTKEEDSEEKEADGLLQRLKKKLLLAKSLKEQQSLETLIKKRREKVSSDKTKQPEYVKRNKPVEDEHYTLPDPGNPFRIQDTSDHHNFWSAASGVQRDREATDFLGGSERLRAENRHSDQHEKELKESITNMETEMKKKLEGRKISMKRLQQDFGRSWKPSPGPGQPRAELCSGGPWDLQSMKSQRRQTLRNPSLRPVGEKTLMEESREAGLAERLGPSNKGFGMLMRMGYREGEGLGREGEGRTEPVGVQVRRGKEGLGS